jgi:hypothetical protein
MSDYNAWAIHILGVSRLVEAEGGILRLPKEISIQQLILWCVDCSFLNDWYQLLSYTG